MGKVVRVGYYAVAAALMFPLSVASGVVAVSYRLAGWTRSDTQADIDLRDRVRAEDVDLRELDLQD